MPVMATVHGVVRVCAFEIGLEFEFEFGFTDRVTDEEGSHCEPIVGSILPELVDHQCADVPGTETVGARVKRAMNLFASWCVTALRH